MTPKSIYILTNVTPKKKLDKEDIIAIQKEKPKPVDLIPPAPTEKVSLG